MCLVVYEMLSTVDSILKILNKAFVYFVWAQNIRWGSVSATTIQNVSLVSVKLVKLQLCLSFLC